MANKDKLLNEYIAYMKKITDAFIIMNGDMLTDEITKESSNYYTINWKGGIEYTVDFHNSLDGSGILFKDTKEYNAKVAKEYLNDNSISYEKWLKLNNKQTNK